MTLKTLSYPASNLSRTTLSNKPKLTLFREPSVMTLPQVEELWANEKDFACPYIQIRITEQESALENAINMLKSLRSILLCRLEGGNKMAFIVALTQVRNTEARRDHLYGILGQLEYLRREINESGVEFDWKQQCDQILELEPSRFSVKDASNLSFDKLKEQVHSYCQSEH